ncbi:hypothetical protein [Alicyclobacillus acidocaldarius]|uniref:hypothetical protein n=1 Tax=Alicyclobacillus acidocaldarius TaxID=405212 RepID=UPI0011D11F01|nr:hypothetical protein [Alicyclobacillus acidocaldarius]MCL6444478.1 hypothetical protein [Alicyclobacillus sp.]
MDTRCVRHLLATIGYRTAKVIKEVPEHYPAFEAGQGIRTPVEILHHMGDVLLIAYRDFYGGEREDTSILSWEQEVDRFFDILESLDQAITHGVEPKKRSWEQLLQGPLADVLTHIGQLATLRRLAGDPVSPESYLRAQIQVGQIRY